MKIRPGSHIWELQDDGPYEYTSVLSHEYYFQQAGRGHETLAIMEEDLKQGVGRTMSRNGVSFTIESVVQLGGDGKRLRVLGSEQPTWGEWVDVTDEVSE